jgi:hypothetical protein
VDFPPCALQRLFLLPDDIEVLVMCPEQPCFPLRADIEPLDMSMPCIDIDFFAPSVGEGLPDVSPAVGCVESLDIPPIGMFGLI